MNCLLFKLKKVRKEVLILRFPALLVVESYQALGLHLISSSTCNLILVVVSIFPRYFEYSIPGVGVVGGVIPSPTIGVVSNGIPPRASLCIGVIILS